MISDFGVCPPALSRDHCDLLLDAIDAQLSRLQVRATLFTGDGISDRLHCNVFSLNSQKAIKTEKCEQKPEADIVTNSMCNLVNVFNMI